MMLMGKMASALPALPGERKRVIGERTKRESPPAYPVVRTSCIG
jgi:hypothetical protein